MKAIRFLFALLAAYALGVISSNGYENLEELHTVFYSIFALSLTFVFILTMIIFKVDCDKNKED